MQRLGVGMALSYECMDDDGAEGLFWPGLKYIILRPGLLRR